MTSLLTRFAALAAMVCVSSAAMAHSDVLVRSSGGQTVLGAAEDLDAEEGGPFFDLETKAFEIVLLNPALPNLAFSYDFERDEPGFFSAPAVPVGDALPANAGLTLTPSAFSIGLGSGNDTVFYWDGTGAVDFEALSTAQPGVSFEAGILTPLVTDGAGSIDNHPLFGLDGGAADGVYLSSYTVTVDGLDASAPIYFVALADSTLTLEDDAELVEEALEEFEEGNIAAPIVGGVDYTFYEEAVEFAEGIPEPSAVLIALVATVGFASRRR
ncbi:MAG: hypothetical protein AAFV43_08940 [Planctomycetota bacterium]